MFELVVPFLVACVLGVISGLVPGVTVFVALLLAYPYIITLDPLALIMVYTVLASMSQFFGSVSAILFSVPGSGTSLPALKEGHTLLRQGLGDKAIMYSAIGSFFGSLFAVVLSIVVVNFLFLFYGLFTTEVKFILLIIIFISFVFIGDNKWYINIFLILLGLTLGYVGYDVSTATSFMTFDNHYLYGGLPSISVVIGIYALPTLLMYLFDTTSISFVKLSYKGYINSIKEVLSYKYTLLRSSTLGFLLGFIPGLSYYISSTVAYYIEKLQKKSSNLQYLLAAETANNAGVFTQLLPLLLIGIPVSNSQAFVYDLLYNSGFDPTVEYLRTMLLTITIAYLISALLGMVFAGKYVNWISVLTKIPFKYIYAFIIILLFGITYFAGSIQYQSIYYVASLLGLLFIGLLLRKYDRMVLIFAFLLQDPVFDTIKTITALYT